MEAKLCCFGIWMVAVLQIASADNSWLLRSITERQLMVASPSIQDGTVRATTILPRRDPLNSLQLYEGGFNIKDPHYWSSVAFTGMWAFSMAFLCLTVGIGASIWWFCDKDCGMASVLPAHANILRGLYCFCIVQFSILAMKGLLAFAAAMILMIVLTGLVAIIKVWRRILRVAFTVMAIVLFASWALSGVCFILSNVATDACQAMKDYERNPETSSFAKMLPCLRPGEATHALNTAKLAIKNLIGQMNGAIDLVNEREELMKLQYANGSFGTQLKHFCDPYGPPPDYQDAQCSKNQSNFSTFETDYAQYRCDEDVVLHCFESDTPIPSSYYSQFIISISAAKEVTGLLPSMFGIMTCAFVKKAFENLTSSHCNNIEASFNTLWIAFAAASIAMMSLQVMWIAIRKHLIVTKDLKLPFIYSPYGLP